MTDNELLVKDLTAKDEQKAFAAAQSLINNKNTEAFQILADKSEFLFDFVKNNVNKRLQKAINKKNFRNLFGFLKIYAPDFEDTIVGAFASYANEDLTDEMLELLENGTESEKTYSAKYFSYIPDTISADLLTDYALNNDNEALAFNAAKALGSMQIDSAYNKAVELLDSDDDFTVLKAVKFLVAYENKDAVDALFKAMEKSSMSENIAGEIPYLESLLTLVQTKKEPALMCLENILSGLGEILPLNQVFNFELYDILAFLISDNQKNKNPQTAVVLLSALAKFDTLANNEEYTFDEDKSTKQEVQEIYNLLKSQQEYFWNAQKRLAVQELQSAPLRVSSALQMICEFKIKDAKEEVKKLLDSDNEIIVCEAAAALKQLDALAGIDKVEILSKIKDENKKAIIESLFN